MKAGAGKRKGGAFERIVCVKLSLWITNGERKDVFWRSAMSGGRATVHGTNVRQAGDIAAVAEEGWPFCNRYFVECKHVRDLMIDCFCVQHKGEMWKFWKVAQRKAEKHNKRPMLIAMQNRWPALVVMQKCDLPEGAPVLCIVGNRKRAACIMRFEDVLETGSEQWTQNQSEKQLKYGWIQSPSLAAK